MKIETACIAKHEDLSLVMDKLRIDQINHINYVTKIISREGKLSTTLSQKYSEWIHQASEKYNIDPILILSVIAVESKFNSSIVSESGQIGLLQIAHSWHQEKSSRIGLFDPKNNILVGTRILREYKNISRSDS